MAKALYIAEKPSVAQEFAKALKLEMRNHNGYKEGETAVVTWCVGHLVTMSYPEVYDEKYKKWSLETLPFLPEEFLYEVIPSAKNQYEIVSQLLNREDVDTIYVCTDSGREGEYIYRLVEQMSGVKDKGKQRKRVWIDSQTEEEILRGIREAKDLSEYDNLSDSAYLRAKEDYLMGINFSRLLTLKYGNTLANYLHERYTVISVGRVMTCVQGMVVRREREIREFVKTPFYRVFSSMAIEGTGIESEWKAVEGSKFYQSPKLYKDNGFLQKEDAGAFIAGLTGNTEFTENENGQSSQQTEGTQAVVEKIEKKNGGFFIHTDQGTVETDALILAAGSKAAPSTGSDGSGYEYARQLGHSIIKPLPALVQLRCQGNMYKQMAGIRTEAEVSLQADGITLAKDKGELQITDYGLSGIPVFQVSRYAARALDEKKKVRVYVDFMPGWDDNESFRLLKKRALLLAYKPAEELFTGMLNRKLAQALLKLAGIDPNTSCGSLTGKQLEKIRKELKEYEAVVMSVNPFANAQVCCGGVDANEGGGTTMGAKICPGLYLAGEILDVDGICGGYNLQFAWSSGMIAGRCAAGDAEKKSIEKKSIEKKNIEKKRNINKKPMEKKPVKKYAEKKYTQKTRRTART